MGTRYPSNQEKKRNQEIPYPCSCVQKQKDEKNSMLIKAIGFQGCFRMLHPRRPVSDFHGVCVGHHDAHADEGRERVQ